MAEQTKLLVVISILEGRGFPKRARHKIYADARFDGELLATDPVDHTETPDFTQELAWEIDKKALQQHRLQRTSIKIQCYATDAKSSLKEPVGYVILDLRSAVQNKQTAKWFPLLHSKYGKAKPEIRLALCLDDDKEQQKDGSIKIIHEQPQTKTNFNLRSLVPMLNEEEGFYQLGPAETCYEQFVLSVTIAYASNLTQLLPSNAPLHGAAQGFFFYYSLLGNDVTNETFSNLLNPSFPAERASVRVRSSVDALCMFFSRQPGLQIHLCCGDQSLGSCEVPLTSLLKKDSTEIYMKPVSVEGEFQLLPPNKVRQQQPVLPNSMVPMVGVSVVLRKEDMGSLTPIKDHANKTKLPLAGNEHAPGLKCSPGNSGSHTQCNRPAGLDHDKERDPKLHKMEIKQGTGDGGEGEQYSESFEEADSQNLPSHKDEAQENQHIKRPGHRETAPYQKIIDEGGTSESVTTTDVHHALPPQAHHFTFTLDLRSVRGIVFPNTLFIFLRYTYPFFGSAAPILTHPPVEIQKGSEVLLPQSFCAFDFACTAQQLQETFLRVPLLIEMWHRDRQLSTNVLLGSAQLPLGQIVTADKIRIMGRNNLIGWRQEFANRIPVISADGTQCSEISAVMSLEDWGPVSPSIVDKIAPPEPAKVTAGPILAETASPRKTAEYQAALELEMWKEDQEKMFEKELKQKEALYMKVLADEWKKRDKEREVLMQKKMTEYTQWESQLKKTLADLEKREKQLAGNEQEVLQLRAELQREHDRKLQEMKEASRRLKEDCDHQVQLERMKMKELEDIIGRYKGELQDADKKYHALEKEFSSFREQLSTKPEVRLQSEINLLTLEKVELERKLESAIQSKNHYKQQWGKALKELAHMKQREQEMAKAALRQQQQELEHMRLRYLAAEEKDVSRNDNHQLEEIKNELNRLKQLEVEKLRQTSSGSNSQDTNKVHTPVLDSSIDEHITRLVEERDTLLRTGVYTTQDKIIMELDRQIREAIAQRNR